MGILAFLCWSTTLVCQKSESKCLLNKVVSYFLIINLLSLQCESYVVCHCCNVTNLNMNRTLANHALWKDPIKGREPNSLTLVMMWLKSLLMEKMVSQVKCILESSTSLSATYPQGLPSRNSVPPTSNLFSQYRLPCHCHLAIHFHQLVAHSEIFLFC